MGGWFGVRRRSAFSRGPLLPWLLLLCLSAEACVAPSLCHAAGPDLARANRIGDAARSVQPTPQPIFAGDVVLEGRNRVLHGVAKAKRVSPKGKKPPLADARVLLLRDGELIAETTTDRHGRFAISNLSGGRYGVAVCGDNTLHWTFYRAWTPEAAPPKAAAVVNVVQGEGVPLGEVVRGQAALPVVPFSEAALTAGVVVGAVAAPVIYHNAQKTNRIPASP